MEREAPHQDSLVVDTLDKVFGSLEPREKSLSSELYRMLVWLGYCILFLPWYIVFSLHNLIRPVNCLALKENYVLFLPNLGQNLAGMFELVSKMPGVAIVMTCPHTVPLKRLQDHLSKARHEKLQVLPLHWLRFVHYSQLAEYIRYGFSLCKRYGNSRVNPARLVFLLVKFSFYGIAVARMRDGAFKKILSCYPAVIVSARPKSHYGNLPFLYAAREKHIPAYYLAHTHIDASAHFHYQVFRRGTFDAFFLLSRSCREVANKNFKPDAEIVVSGDPCLDRGADARLPVRNSAGKLRVIYAASTFYGQDSMCDLARVARELENVELIVKSRPPGRNTAEIIRLLGEHAKDVVVLDHADTGPIEDILDDIDVVVGCATNSLVSCLLRGRPGIAYINDIDREIIASRNMERLPYEQFGIPVISEVSELKPLLRKLTSFKERQAFLEYQLDQANRQYPNLQGSNASDVILERVLQHLQ